VGTKPPSDQQLPIAELYRQIGQLQVERDFFSQPVGAIGATDRQALVDPNHAELSIV
jgi:hypothetical protein